MTQKKAIKKQKERLDQLKREAEEERQRARQAARERVLDDFEKGHLGLGATSTTTTTSGTDNSECMFSSCGQRKEQSSTSTSQGYQAQV